MDRTAQLFRQDSITSLVLWKGKPIVIKGCARDAEEKDLERVSSIIQLPEGFMVSGREVARREVFAVFYEFPEEEIHNVD